MAYATNACSIHRPRRLQASLTYIYEASHQHILGQTHLNSGWIMWTTKDNKSVYCAGLQHHHNQRHTSFRNHAMLTPLPTIVIR